MAISVLLLTCVVLGSACTGAKGEEGDKGADGVGIQSIANNTDGTLTIYLTNGQSYTTGDLTGPQGEKGDTGAQGIQGVQGIQGTQGIPGPDRIVATGSVDLDGTLRYGYNVTSSTWDRSCYEIDLGADYTPDDCVTLVSPFTWTNRLRFASFSASVDKHLFVYIFDVEGNLVQGLFSFMVLV